MKKLLLIVLVCCSHSLFAQTGNTCPPGLCPQAYISIDEFNFHKPRTGCKSGFGLCIKISTGVRCERCSNSTVFTGAKVIGYINVSGKKAELHLPLSLTNSKEFEKTDMSTFEVEDKTISLTSKETGETWVKGGVYTVETKGEDLVIVLDLY